MDSEEFRKSIGRTMEIIFNEGGITDEYLRGKIKQQLNYKEPIELIHKDQETGEKTILRIKTLSPAAMRIQQDATKESFKLKGKYPAEKHELSGDISVNTGIQRPGDEEKPE